MGDYFVDEQADRLFFVGVQIFGCAGSVPRASDRLRAAYGLNLVRCALF